MKIQLTLLPLFMQAALGAANTWTDAAHDGDWLNTANWSLGTLPTTADQARIDSGTPSVNLAGTAENKAEEHVGSLMITTDGSLTIENATLYIDSPGDVMAMGTTTGTSELIIKSGGTLEFTNATGTVNMYIGLYANENAYVRVETGGVLDLTMGASDEFGEIKVGNQGNGVLDIAGGHVVSSYGRIGNQTNGNGTVIVDNGGEWIIANDLYLGNRGGSVGKLEINDGRVHTGTYVSIGEKYNTPQAEVTINGGELSGETYLYIGRGANGTLTMTDGLVSFNDILIGNNNAFVYSGTGTALLQGGEMYAANSLVIGYASKAGLLKMENDAIVTTDTITIGRSSAGTLEIATDSATLRNKAGDGLTAIAGGNSNGTVQFSHTGSLGFANVMSGAKLAVVHSGAGKTVITGTNTYAGGTTLTAGTLVSGNEAALGTGLLLIDGGTYQSTVSNADIGSISLVSGSIDLNDDTAYTLTLAADFSMTGGTYALDILSLGSFDQILGNTGQLTLSGGILSLNGYTGFEGNDTQGFSYQIFDGFAPADIGNITIDGYDKSNWTAKLDSTGLLSFEKNQPIPEPATATLGLLALTMLFSRRRKA